MSGKNARFSIFLGQEPLVRVGTLWLNHARGRVASSFVYDEDWLHSSGRFELGPDLPLDAGPVSMDGLFSCFRDCSPDRWGRSLVARMEEIQAKSEGRAPATMLDSDHLLRVNDFTRQGALRMSADDGRTWLADPGRGACRPLPGRPVCARRWGASAGRRKAGRICVSLRNAGHPLAAPAPRPPSLGHKASFFLLSFPDRRARRSPPGIRTLRLAQNAGLATPDFRLHKAAGQNVLVVRRFDRKPAGDGVLRIPFITAMSLLGLGDGNHAGYVDMAAAIEAQGSAPDEDLPELWSRMVFNMCVYNVDDHAKNHGFLRKQGGWRLSPVFDLETSHPGEKAALLHTAVIDQSREFSLENALEVAEFFRLSQNEARERLTRIRRAVACWRQEASSVHARPEEMRVMREAFEFL